MILISDIATKLIVFHILPVDSYPRPFIGDLLRWTHIHNSGAAFGLFRGSRLFFIVVSAVSVVAIFLVVRSRRHRSALTLMGFGMVLGGALGNLLDRLWLGVVIDFIDMGWGTLRWPVFNVADMGVSIGVMILGFGLFLEDIRRTKAESTDSIPSDSSLQFSPGGETESGDRRIERTES
ncbi:MAG: signal peptidase II [Candidatus Eisenbacteria bacterium]|uniref:Lipoprotein signal peptidase n=1 Tax=Eiseniibacteriota bacterium TaxID=2212470 RepID=A0A948S129_UNCEI|nr:signal peptidase II [Candidatus Eisenbacteria bacterium]MBU1948430.1 signal peptidase II [Candidatus Eisenbacteria bacterium]MBU2692907.1 signal peptidase II [Candidatus Eisenbacteria bacterium]